MTVNITRLSNGLLVATDRMEAVETVSLGVWVGAGTRNERPEVNGIAHMLEHMAFKGTARRSAQAIAEEIEAVGGQINAYTSREQTAYYVKVLAGDTPLAVDILGDILQNSTFEPAELERERTVILQEIGQAKDTPDDIIFDHFQAAAFPDQPMGRAVLGTADIIRHLKRPALFDYLGAEYGAGRMILAAAGRLDHDAIVELAQRAFGNLRGNDATRLEPALYKGGDMREERDLEQLHIVLGFKGIALDDPDFYPSSALSTLLGGGMSSRLFQEVREKRGLAYSIYAFGASYSDAGIFGVYAGTSENDAKELVSVIAGEMRAVAGKVTTAELARARAQLKASTLMALESTGARCERLAQNLMVYGRIVPVEEIVTKIDAIDEASVERVAARLLTSAPTVAAVGPLSQLGDYGAIASTFQ
ncbi:MAG: pitrilysin family protein [Alphaproteobacteria bacterium]|nr:pitrilysin family protein [Alphaproteobacteria bacterium]